MLDKILAGVSKWGWLGVIKALLAPILLPFFMPSVWSRTLWNSRCLLFGRWGRFHGFDPQNSLNGFFYKTQWINLDRFGRNGTSTLVGLGDYSLSRWFHLALFSSFVYAHSGAVTVLAGMLLWVLFHLVWLETSNAWWVGVVIVVLLFSSTAFAMAFRRQNYNILGWLWLPIGLFAVLNEYWIIAAFAWFAASLGSVTAVFVAVPLVTTLAIQTAALEALFGLIPALVKIALHLLPLASGVGNPRTALANMAKVIGVSSRGARYIRRGMRFDFRNVYFALLYATGTSLAWYGSADAPWLVIVALALFVLNQRFIRFADDQSVILAFVSSIAAWTLMHPGDWWAFAGLVMAANPLPMLLGLRRVGNGRDPVRVEPLAPFDHVQILNAMRSFLRGVPEGKRIYFAFRDPAGVYEDIFDGYRVLLELPLFVAAENNVHLFPDWYSVAETNYQGAPSCWGRSLSEVKENMSRWNAEYTIVYRASGEALSGEWLREFEVISRFDWADWVLELKGAVGIWPKHLPAPEWTLLKIRAPSICENSQVPAA